MEPFSTCAFQCHHALNLEPNQRWDTGAHQIKLSTSVNKIDCRMKFRPVAKWAFSFVFRPQVYSNPVIGNARNLRLLPQKQATCKTWVCIEYTVCVLRVHCLERKSSRDGHVLSPLFPLFLNTNCSLSLRERNELWRA